MPGRRICCIYVARLVAGFAPAINNGARLRSLALRRGPAQCSPHRVHECVVDIRIYHDIAIGVCVCPAGGVRWLRMSLLLVRMLLVLVHILLFEAGSGGWAVPYIRSAGRDGFGPWEIKQPPMYRTAVFCLTQ